MPSAIKHALNVNWVISAALSALLACLFPATAASQPTNPAAPAPVPDQELVPEPVAVTLGGESIFWLTVGAGPYTPQFRAGRISQRLLDVVRDRSVQDLSVTVTDLDGASELRVGSRLLMVVTAQDAASFGVARRTVADQAARTLEAAMRAERQRYSPSALLRGAAYSLFATLLLAVSIWLIRLLTRTIGRVWSRWWARRAGLRVLTAEVISADGLGRAIEQTLRAIRWLLIFVALELYLTYVLGLFPWTRAVSFHLLDYVLTPFRAAFAALVDYLPSLFFVLVIAGIVYGAIRLVSVFFDQIRYGRIEFESFPAEWAELTNKIVRVLLIALGVVVAFPYLPASNSPAFAGVSVFVGLLLSLASSSALSNSIAGVVLTYTRAFRLGDRVKVGDAYGDIVETSLLATHIRTIKNEDITIPNGIVLGSSVINYSRVANTLGLILHTSVTIGYATPWRQVHGLLIEAALGTPGVLTEPKPFVWQTALNDFYITYEINAYTGRPKDMNDTYAVLHSRIQDAFAAAGVEIMSPHYFARRDGDPSTVPPSAGE